MITALCFEKKILQVWHVIIQILSIYITDGKSNKYAYHNINNHTYQYCVD